MTQSSPPAALPGPLLFSLNGKPAPPGLGEAIARLSELSADLLERLDELLLPNLGDMPEDQRENRIGRLCRRNELDPEMFGPVVKGCAFLIRSAAAFDVDANAFSQDVRAIGATEEVATRLAGLFEQVRGEMRADIARAAIAAHGKVLAGVEWRVDNLASSSRGRGLNLPVALVTFHYQDGPRADRITLQMLPEMVGSLRVLCDELLEQ